MGSVPLSFVFVVLSLLAILQNGTNSAMLWVNILGGWSGNDVLHQDSGKVISEARLVFQFGCKVYGSLMEEVRRPC